jgi:hypothetical protein
MVSDGEAFLTSTMRMSLLNSRDASLAIIVLPRPELPVTMAVPCVRSRAMT